MKQNILQTVLICGYRRSGKNHLGSLLCTPRISKISKPQWKLYGKYINIKLLISPNAIQTAFADKVKEEVSENYNIPLLISDKLKDKKIFKRGDKYFSQRDFCIEWANYKKMIDPDYWIKRCAENFSNSSLDDKTLVITDWRYLNEVNYMNLICSHVVTIRVYRSRIEEPSITSQEEHQLDKTTTDFLAVTSEKEFILARQRFPQYQNYLFVQDIY